MENELFTIEEIKHLAEMVVNRYVAKKAIPSREKGDVVMSVIEKFLKRRQRIDDAFEGKSKLSTYYIAVFNRMCCEVIRKEQKHWYTVSEYAEEAEPETSSTSFVETDKQLFIKEELKRLGFVLQTFGGEEAKIYLFVRYYYRLPLILEYVVAYCRINSDEVAESCGSKPAKTRQISLTGLPGQYTLQRGKKLRAMLYESGSIKGLMQS